MSVDIRRWFLLANKTTTTTVFTLQAPTFNNYEYSQIDKRGGGWGGGQEACYVSSSQISLTTSDQDLPLPLSTLKIHHYMMSHDDEKPQEPPTNDVDVLFISMCVTCGFCLSFT